MESYSERLKKGLRMQDKHNKKEQNDHFVRVQQAKLTRKINNGLPVKEKTPKHKKVNHRQGIEEKIALLDEYDSDVDDYDDYNAKSNDPAHKYTLSERTLHGAIKRCNFMAPYIYKLVSMKIKNSKNKRARKHINVLIKSITWQTEQIENMIGKVQLHNNYTKQQKKVVDSFLKHAKLVCTNIDTYIKVHTEYNVPDFSDINVEKEKLNRLIKT